ncbi:response regulator [Mongoliimonas terrestris]|uniref:response regulator n=1 Tax=Mongoliimonas terrestris TaxID=1709001 RepID=UPI000949AA52|nr:response regulator [Mongoliimonas terrestris]
MPAFIDSPSMLVIERQAALAAVIAKVAKKAGIYTVATTSSAAEAAAQLATNRFQIILVDVHEWAMAERQFVDYLQQSQQSGAVLGLMASAFERNVTIVAREDIWSIFLVKPFSPGTLRLKLFARGIHLNSAHSEPKPAVKISPYPKTDAGHVVEI